MDTTAAKRSFSALSLSPETLASLEAKGYDGADRRAGGDDPARPRGQGPRGAVAHGHRQDRGLRHPDRREGRRGARRRCRRSCSRPRASWPSRWRRRSPSSAAGAGVKVESVYGGDSMERQLEGIRAGAHVIAGTPGRVLDHLRRGTLDFSGVHFLVLDEADRMLDMGFAVEMGQIMEFVPGRAADACSSRPRCRSGSAGLIYHYMAEPEWVLLSEDQIYVKEVEHVYCLTSRAAQGGDPLPLLEYENAVLLDDLLQHPRGDARGRHLPAQQGPRRGDALLRPAAEEARAGDGAASAAGEIRHLVTTDVASRGIDIEDLSHVFIFSTPDSPEQYIHRAGRTGRVGKSGRAISLIGGARPDELQPPGEALPRRGEGDRGPDRRGGAGAEGRPHRRGAGRGRAAPAARRLPRPRPRGPADRRPRAHATASWRCC